MYCLLYYGQSVIRNMKQRFEIWEELYVVLSHTTAWHTTAAHHHWEIEEFS